MNQSLSHQMVRYLMVGLLVFASDYATYSAILWAEPGAYLPANMAGKAVGAGLGFVLHKYVTFSWDQKHGTGRQFLSYLGVFAINLASSSLLLWLLVDMAGMGKYLAKLIVDAVVIATSFVLGRIWVYRAA